MQVALGAITAHYGVEGGGFYGIPLAKWLPYSIARTWHLQIGIFWIATAWLATGLFIVPAVSGAEPKGQRLGVNVLFVALVAVVVGSLAGEWLGIQQKLGNLWFWLGSQGYEYVDLGRALADPAVRRPDVLAVADVARIEACAGTPRRESFAADAVPDLQHAIPLFYAAGLMYGQRSPLSSPNTGAGGWCTCGWKGSSKSSPPWSSPSCSRG